ncbi:type II secretion system F family protein [Pseudoduganella sp. GCM10020061]|uniref:type II secretion system F family protein n=1 Tax=Pseudoduganella sp. GCM10020061 TaxID=3317345 RepID=UPI0036407265
MDNLFYIFAVLVFAAVVLLLEGAFVWWTERYGASARRIGMRLRLMSTGTGAASEDVSILKQRRYANGESLDEFLHALPGAARVDRLLVQAGLPWLVSRALGLTAGALLLGVALVMTFPVPLPAAACIILMLASIPYGILVRARTKRMKKIEEQLPEAADFISRALRAGHSFANVLQMAGTELPEPLGVEFRTAHEEIHYGVPMTDALHNLAVRVPLTDVRYLVIAVVIQRESGGNLAEILASISAIIRQRLQLRARVRVLSAEGRLSAWVLSLMPFVIVAAMSIVNPKYISVLWNHPSGVTIIWLGLTMILVGIAWLRGVIHIRV